MKTLFISVPQWYPMNPYLAGAVLTAQCKQKGYEAQSYDLNIRFFNDILTEKRVLQSLQNALGQLPALMELYKSIPDAEKSFSTLPRDVKTKLLRLKAIKEYFEKNGDKAQKVAESVEDAVAVMKDKARFYEPETLFQAKDTLADALKIISLPYAPSRIQLDNFIADSCMSFSYEDVKAQCYDYERNMFLPYFEEIFNTIPLGGCEIIGISVTDLSQLIPALTLGRLIKEKTAQRVVFGGNYIYKIITEIKQNPEFFTLFCDYVSVGDGEIAAVELLDYCSGKLALEEVHSLVYFNGQAVVTNPDAPCLKLDTLAVPDFTGYDFTDYFSPDIVLPVQLGKGCYWGKCEFCDFYTGQQKFDIKSVNHAADEVELLQKKYGVKHFVFVDEAVPPQFYDKFIDELIRRDIHIYFYSFARFDSGFTRPLLKKLHENGAMYFSWGYEAASERLLKLMNKGIVPAVRERILHDCVEIGMWTQCTFLLGYPTETPEELQKTIDVIENRRLINSCTPSNFVLKKNAILKNDTDKVGITEFHSNGDFHISYSYQSDGISMAQVKQNRMVFERRFLAQTANSLWSLGFTDTDHLLLYLSRYGRDFVRDYRLQYKKEVNG